MRVLNLSSLLGLAVTVTLMAGCARSQSAKHNADQSAASGDQTTQSSADPTVLAAAHAQPDAAPHASRADLEREFYEKQESVNQAVRKLEHEHQVYATERSWGSTFKSWFAWPLKKDRAAIHDLIRQVAVASERQVEIARELKSDTLAIHAEIERARADRLLATLDDFNAHDHNKNQ